MKALVKSKREIGLWMDNVDRPALGPNGLYVKIKKTAICGTDVHIYNWDEWAQKTLPIPIVTGHEFVGIVEEVGSSVRGYKVGDRVSGEGHITCGHCRNCRAGRRQAPAPLIARPSDAGRTSSIPSWRAARHSPTTSSDWL